MNTELDNDNPNYPYFKEDLITQLTALGYPIIESVNNANLFPLKIKDSIDTPEFKDYD